MPTLVELALHVCRQRLQVFWFSIYYCTHGQSRFEVSRRLLHVTKNFATMSCRSYGDVNALDNTKVIVGDYQPSNIYIQNSTFHLSYPCLLNATANTNYVAQQSKKSLIRLGHGSANTLGSDPIHIPAHSTAHTSFQPRRVENHSFDNETKSGTTPSTWLHTTSMSATSVLNTNQRSGSTNEHKPYGSEIMSRTGDEERPLCFQSVNQNNATMSLNLQTTPNCNSNAKCSGTDIKHQTSDAQSASESRVSIVFGDDFSKICTFARKDDQHKIFFLRKDGLDWSQSKCLESFMPASEINDRINYGPKKYRRYKQNVQRTLDKFEPLRRRTVEVLWQELNRCDPHGYTWHIVATDIENIKLTKRTGEVAVFSVIFAKTGEN